MLLLHANPLGQMECAVNFVGKGTTMQRSHGKHNTRKQAQKHNATNKQQFVQGSITTASRASDGRRQRLHLHFWRYPVLQCLHLLRRHQPRAGLLIKTQRALDLVFYWLRPWLARVLRDQCQCFLLPLKTRRVPSLHRAAQQQKRRWKRLVSGNEAANTKKLNKLQKPCNL